MVSPETRTRYDQQQNGVAVGKNGRLMGGFDGTMSIPVEFLSYSQLVEITGNLLTRIRYLEKLVDSQSQLNRRIKKDFEYKGIGGCMKDIHGYCKFVHDQDRIPDVPKGQLLRSQSEGLLKSTEVQGQNSQGVKTKVLSKRKLRPCSYCSETHVWGKLNCPCFGKRCSYCAIFNHNQASCWFKQMDD